jgi:hypothetical protein
MAVAPIAAYHWRGLIFQPYLPRYPFRSFAIEQMSISSFQNSLICVYYVMGRCGLLVGKGLSVELSSVLSHHFVFISKIMNEDSGYEQHQI